MGKFLLFLAVIAGAITFGYNAGSDSNATPEVVVKYVKSMPEVITHVETKEVVKTTPLPDSCKSAIEYTNQTFAQDELISKYAGLARDNFGEKGKSIASNDMKGYVKANQEVIDHGNDLIDALYEKGEIVKAMNRYKEMCELDTK